MLVDGPFDIVFPLQGQEFVHRALIRGNPAGILDLSYIRALFSLLDIALDKIKDHLLLLVSLACSISTPNPFLFVLTIYIYPSESLQLFF